jgi:hypothetical protein
MAPYSVLKRLLGSAGCFRGVEVPEELNDDLLDDLPYVDLFYRFLHGWAIAFLLRNAPSRRSRLETIAGGVFGLERRRRPPNQASTTQELKWLHQSLFAKH